MADLRIPVEFASQRKIRDRNKLYYRVNNWPIWVFAYFILPGPLTFNLFAHGVDGRILLWLAVVAGATAVAGLCQRLPGTEARPLIVRFVEERPNPVHRRVCYTVAWSELIAFQALNTAGLIVAVATGTWYLKQIYQFGYFPVVGAVWVLGWLGKLPRAKLSTRGEGFERRQFYGTVWAVATAQPVLWLVWKVLPQSRAFDALKLAIYLGVFLLVGALAHFGRLPRTRPIVGDEFAISA
jgi:hypothetical protein